MEKSFIYACDYLGGVNKQVSLLLTTEKAVYCKHIVEWEVKVKKYSFLRKEQLQPVRNEASLQADGTYTTNSRFDFFWQIWTNNII